MFKKRYHNQEVAEIITVGDCLRRKREENSLSLKKISDDLGIKNEYLDNLEKGNYNELPPQVYVRGFIKSYAGYLGIDGGQLVRIYNREVVFSQKDNEGKKEKSVRMRFFDYLTVTPKLITIAFSLFVIVLLGYYFLHQINSFNSKPYLFVENPAFDQVVKEKDIAVKGKTESDAILKVNGQDVSVNGDGVFNQKISLSEGNNTLVIEAWNRFNKSERKEFNIVYEKPITDEDTAIREADGLVNTQDINADKANDKQGANISANKDVPANAGADTGKKNAAVSGTLGKGSVPVEKKDIAVEENLWTETQSEDN